MLKKESLPNSLSWLYNVSLNEEFYVSVISLAWRVMALNLSSVTDPGIGCIVLCLSCFVFIKSMETKLPEIKAISTYWRRVDVGFLAGKVCTEKAQSHLSHNQQRS